MADRICSIPDCSSPHYGRGYCNRHYKRWRKTGDPALTHRVVGDDHARLLARTDKAGPIPDRAPHLGPCWLWVGRLTADGYGQVRVSGSTVVAHRWAWLLAGNSIPEGMELDHLCAVRHCVRIEHLEVVTHLENMRRREPRKE